MALPDRPKLRPIESFPRVAPGGEVQFVLRDPQGFADPITIPYPAAVSASLMDGSRTIAELREEAQRRLGAPVELSDLEGLVSELEHRLYLDGERFRAHWKREVEIYLNLQQRPAALAGKAYESDPEELRARMAATLTGESGPGLPTIRTEAPVKEAPVTEATVERVSGVISPHFDLDHSGPATAWAHKHLVEQSDANLFLILGTAHSALSNPVSISKKSFETPLGLVETDQKWITNLAVRLKRTSGGTDWSLSTDELAHRYEHSIEFQVLWLQYLLGGQRPFKVVPILVGSLHEFIRHGVSPATSPQLTAFIEAIRTVAAEQNSRLAFIVSADLAHIGQRFGDRELINQARLDAQTQDDQRLLQAICGGDAEALFNQVAERQDPNRISGWAPIYVALCAMAPVQGEVLKYAQAIEGDGTSCVSFASVALRGD